MPPKERQEPGLLTSAAEELLAHSDVEVLGRLAYSSNQTFLVRCRRDGSEVGGVYKPASGERPLSDFPAETLYQREVAAYELSRWLGWDLVPPTVARTDGPLGPGSIQLFVDHDPEQHYFTLLNGYRRAFRRIAFFDILTNNADRKAGHCLADPQGRIWLIDHGLTFHAEPKLRTVIWDFGGEKLPLPERRAAEGLAASLADDTSDIFGRLTHRLSRDEVQALRDRASRLSKVGAFPEPTSAWAFPWPLV